METKTERWNVRVTPAQDAAVRRIIAETGESLNDFVVRHAVTAAQVELADRRVFAVDDPAWDALQAVLDRPPMGNSELARLMATDSVLER